MSATYLHGVETIDVTSGTRTIAVVKTAVIGLIGIAPAGEKNKPIVVNSDRDAAQFGKQIPGFSIPQSLDKIFLQGAGTVIVVNVFDAATHTTQVTDEVKVVKDGALQLTAAPIGVVTIKDAQGAAVTYVEGTDYNIDDYGNFVVLSNIIADNVSLKFSYKKLNEAAITSAVIIGGIDADTGVRTGMKCFDLSKNLFGFIPKILIAPTYSSDNAIAAEMISYMDKYRAIGYLDAPAGTTIANAVAGRGPLGAINFNTSSKRAELLFPQITCYDAASDSNINFPFSAFKAGMRAAIDNSEGYWVSDSNHEIKGALGSEVDIYASINDPNSDTNTLNAAGITTVFNTFGSGIRTWGNRSASYPTNTAPDNFISIRRVADIVADSIEQSALDLVDLNITQAWIDTVRESVNSFIRTLVGRGALIGGSCTYNPDNNPLTELQNGHVTFDYDLMPPPPAERITFNQFINIAYLQTLK